jgi:hypothetical protein
MILEWIIVTTLVISWNVFLIWKMKKEDNNLDK